MTLVIGQVVVDEEVIAQDEISPCLLLLRWVGRHRVWPLAAVAGGAIVSGHNLAFLPNLGIRGEVILAVFSGRSGAVDLYSVFEWEGIPGGEEERHVRHSLLGLHPWAVWILAGCADQVEFAWLEISRDAFLDVERVQRPRSDPQIMRRAFVDVDAG